MQCVQRLHVSLATGGEADYVIAMAATAREGALVVATSACDVRVYDCNGGSGGACLRGVRSVHRGHDTGKRLTGVATFNTAAHEAMFVTSSTDRTVRVWDARAGEAAVAVYKSAGFEAWCCDVSADDAYVAAGAKDVVLVWDVRTGKAFRRYGECHGQEVTCVRFHPQAAHAHMLLSGGEEGTVCMNDTRRATDDDVEMVLNAEQAVASFALYSGCNDTTATATATAAGGGADTLSAATSLPPPSAAVLDRVCVLSQIDSVSLWRLDTHTPVASFSRASGYAPAGSAAAAGGGGGGGGGRLDGCSFVGSFVVNATQALCLVGSGAAGELSVMRASAHGGVRPVASSTHYNGATGHTAPIRSFAYLQRANLLVTGGEDGALCVWSDQPPPAVPLATVSPGATGGGGGGGGGDGGGDGGSSLARMRMGMEDAGGGGGGGGGGRGYRPY